MARTIAEIYLSIVAEKNNQPTINALQPTIDNEQTLLNDLSSTSKVAVWRLFAYIISVAIWTHENLWDLFKAAIEALIAGAYSGTTRWYQQQALLFQFGDSLTWINNKFQYSVIDATKQIIKRSAAIETGGAVIIKVAKLVGGLPVKLNANEFAAYQAYLAQIKFAGTNISSISYDPDLLKLTLNIVYNPLVLASDGSLLSDSGIFPVEDAIKAYIAGIVWDGTFNLTKLIDAAQAAQGVVDPILTLAEGKAYNGASFGTITQNYQSVAGYMVVDPANPLSGTLTYTPNV